MSESTDRPLEHWIAIARMGFERDFSRIFGDLGIKRADLARKIETSPAYVSKVLNGTGGNFTLETMAKWARAIGAVVQVRLVKEGSEVVRVVDYETAAMLDGVFEAEQKPAMRSSRVQTADVQYGGDNVRRFPSPQVDLTVTGAGGQRRAANG